MNYPIALAFALCGLDVFAQEQVSKPLISEVSVSEYGMRFGLCDNLWEASITQVMLERKELIADRPLTWFLRDTSTNNRNWNSVVFLGMSNSFALQMLTLGGDPVSKTEKGKRMSAGPTSLTDLRANPFVRRTGPGFSDFPRLTELFEFPSNGVYVLEARYWMWDGIHRKFSLSDAVRFKVIKQDSGNPAVAPEAPANTPPGLSSEMKARTSVP